MLKATAITHVAFEGLGSLEPQLRRAGYTIDMVDACTADLRSAVIEESDLLIVLGGPIGVYECESYPFLKAELDLLRSRLARKRPTFGICLGAQLIAAAAGADVYPGSQGREIGWGTIHAGPAVAECPGFERFLDPGLRVLHWHGDTFDLPANSFHLAGTDAYPNQAFVIERHTLALQFHPEVTARGLERWYVGHAVELGKAGIYVPQLRQQSETFAAPLEEVAQHFWKEWLLQL